MINEARQRPPKPRIPQVPDEAVDECEQSHHAAQGEKQNGGDMFDDHGLMSLVCRHDILLFFANMDSPGEQQKYAIALIVWLYSLIPPEATVVVLYDIACVLTHSIELVSLFLQYSA